jgi:hypothetical protein
MREAEGIINTGTRTGQDRKTVDGGGGWASTCGVSTVGVDSGLDTVVVWAEEAKLITLGQ